MVQSASSTGLVTITQMQPAAVTFSVPQSEIPTLVSVLHQGQSLPATLYDQDNQHQLGSGEVKFISNQIDTATGTVALKAVFANQDESLFANQFVNLRLQTRVLKGATVIPAQALQPEQRRQLCLCDQSGSQRHAQSGHHRSRFRRRSAGDPQRRFAGRSAGDGRDRSSDQRQQSVAG
ncbi:Efflux pump periplasmic linker BepD precursor [Pantoea agglomerans]|uniref:Efflux pump periplasmic linker BepD n=1 Tax=Enterobacter agglomerans TaxID=549 RepID=A0A379ALA4_ENTAG|nr:Efflux pump periplasmic linker BepD precursor [Pantoea agglomerans]